MHNNIMAGGSRDRPPMLATGRYAQWRSRFLRYIDTRPNGDALRKCILKGPYTPTFVTTPAVPATEDSPAVPEQTTVQKERETVTNMTPENRAHYESEKEAIHLILTGIGDEIYSTVDACQTAQEMWEAIERLQQGESLNIQDVKTNLFWEFGQFTSHDGETIESYYTRFYKMMNEMIRNNLTVATMQVNVQFLQQLQPEWSRFVTIVKQQHKLDEVSYHKLFDILKQYQKEVNELRAERMAKNANPLALVATAQTLQDPYYQSSKSHKSYAPTSKASLPTRSHAATRYKGKEIAKPITPPSESASEEDSDPEQAQKDKDMQKNLALIAKYFKKLYKPTNNNLRTSSNTRNKNVDTTPRYKNDNQTGQFGNQRAINVVGARETVGSPVVQQSGIQCFNCKGICHYAKECKSKRIQEVPNATSGNDADPCGTGATGLELEGGKTNGSDSGRARDVGRCAERLRGSAHLGSASTRAGAAIHHYNQDDELTHQIVTRHGYDSRDFLRTVSPIWIVTSIRHIGTVRFGNDQFTQILGYEDLVQGNITINRVYYVEGLNHNLFSVGQFCDADLEVAFRKSTCFVRDLQGNDLLTGNRGSDLYTISLQDTTSSTPICLMAKASPTQAWLWHRRLSHLNFDYINLLSKKDIVIGLPKLKYVKDHLCSSCEVSKAKRSSFKSKTVPSSKGRLNLLHMDLCGPMRVASINGKKYILVIVDDYSRYTWTLFLRSKDETPEVLKDFLTMIQRNLQAPVISVRTDRGTEFLNKTLNAFFKEEGIEHQTSTPRTPEQNGVVERRNRTLVEAARTMLSASKLPLFFWAEAIATACYTQNRSIIIPTHEKTAYHIINDRKPSIKHLHIFGCTCYLTRDDITVPLQQELDLLFGPLYDEFFNDGTYRVNKSSSPTDNSTQPDTLPSTNTHHTSEPTTLTNDHAEENNDNQVEFTNPFYSEYRWKKDHLLTQVHGNPSKPVQTRRQLATNPEMCMFALTVSIVESKNIKDAMTDSAWIEAMQEELYQFDRLQVWELIDKPFGKNIIKLKWLWKNKKDEDQTVIRNKADQTVIRNKARLVAKGICSGRGIVFRRIICFQLLAWSCQDLCHDSLSDHPDKVYRLRKALYGLKQAPRAWYDELSKFLISKGFSKGLQIHQSPRGIFINQAKYTLEILKKHGMEKGQSIGTPMTTKPKLDADLSGEPVDQTDYRSKIGSLMYLTSSRPDIVQAVCYCARYQARPMKNTTKRLKRMLSITSFSDVDHAGCIDTRKSTSGGIQFLGDKLVIGCQKKQDCTGNVISRGRIRVFICKLLKTEFQLANMFTKALPEVKVSNHRQNDWYDGDDVYKGRMQTKIELTPGTITTRSYALSWKPCQGDSLNLPDHRIHKDGDGDFLHSQLESNSLPHSHAQTTQNILNSMQDSRIMKLKIKLQRLPHKL
ncbi:retrovirus-related pol polyprotein from transposon TNT 1-94 [Tanacetum coccineum]